MLSPQALLAAIIVYVNPTTLLVLSSNSCRGYARSTATGKASEKGAHNTVNGYMAFILFSVAGLACECSLFPRYVGNVLELIRPSSPQSSASSAPPATCWFACLLVNERHHAFAMLAPPRVPYVDLTPIPRRALLYHSDIYVCYLTNF